jgi:hypothetical protein
VGGDPVYNTDVFVVVKPRFLSTPGNVFSIGSRPGKAADFTSLAITSSGYWKINSQGGTRDVTSSVPEQLNLYSNDTNFRLLNMSLSNTNYVLRRNSVEIASANKSWSPTLSNYQYLLAKRSIPDGADPFDGSIGEVIVFDNIINNEKRTIVESYLAYKWNLIALLPENHPARLTNRPIQIGGLSLAAEPNGFVRRARMVKIFVLAPQSPTITTSQITIGGAIFAISWTPNGGTADYYLVTIQQSINDSTWTTVAYNFRYTITEYNHQIGGVDNKYYRAIIQSKNSGGSASTTSDSLLNSVPAPPSPSAPNFNTGGVIMAWTPVFPGGIPASYTAYLYENDILINTYSSITATSYNSTTILTMLAVYKFKVSATNSIGTSSDSVFSSAVQYNGQGS